MSYYPSKTRWPRCKRAVKAIAELGYTDICTEPGGISAISPVTGDWVEYTGSIKGYRSIVAMFADALANPDAYRFKPRPPSPEFLASCARDEEHAELRRLIGKDMFYSIFD